MKSGGVELAGIERGVAIIFLFALIALSFAAAIALAVESHGQTGTSIALVSLAASGLPWLTRQVMDTGAAHARAKRERIDRAG